MLLERFRLDDRVALITGAGRGIGAAVARTLAEAGANAVLAARTEEQLNGVAADIADLGRRALVVPVDVNELINLEGLVRAAVTEFGRLDVVVNNAGGTMPRQLLETTPGYFERAFHFNVTTAFALSKAAVPHLLETRGNIVNISSSIGRLRNRGSIAYGTAKAALSHMTRMMAADLAPKARVNAVAVGSTATTALERVLTADGIRNEMIARTPMGRLGEPEDIALAVLYLASPAASWITGKVLEVDGGQEEPNLITDIPDL